jgi:O-antigen ligase
LVRLAELANPFKASSLNDRVQTKWGPALETIKSNPFGVGIGFGSQTKASREAEESNNYVQPHNELIQKVLETGFAGGILYLLLLIYLFKDFKIISKFEDSDRLFGFAMIAVTITFWICGLVNLPFSGTSGLLYWALAGAALALKDRHVSNWNMAKFVDDMSDNNLGRKIQNETSNLA